MFDPCFGMQFFVSFLVLQSSSWGRENWLFLDVMLLVLLFTSSSQCLWLVCGV